MATASTLRVLLLDMLSALKEVIMKFVSKVERLLAKSLVTAPAELTGDAPAVSFSFDDFPKTAYTNAGKILEDNEARGTYFLSTDLIDTHYEGQAQCDTKDLQNVIDNGHEIGGHTQSHKHLQTLNKAEMEYEIVVNRDFIRNTLDTEVSSFAFPFGGTSPQAKKAVLPHYRIARSINPGLNSGRIDRMHIKAYSLYGENFCLRRIEQLVEETLRQNAWLVFYTHDVQNKHSAYGCSVNQFEAVVNAVKTRQIDIRTMSAVSRDSMHIDTVLC